MPLSAAGTPSLRWGEVQALVMGLLKQTDSHLYADLTDARYALSVVDVHLIYLTVSWMNSHREKGTKALEAPSLYKDARESIVITDEDRAHAEQLLMQLPD